MKKALALTAIVAGGLALAAPALAHESDASCIADGKKTLEIIKDMKSKNKNGPLGYEIDHPVSGLYVICVIREVEKVEPGWTIWAGSYRHRHYLFTVKDSDHHYTNIP